MKNTYRFPAKKLSLLIFFITIVFSVHTQNEVLTNSDEYLEYSGVVVDSQTGDPLVFASLSISDTNISTITNTDGEFLLKVPGNSLDAVVRGSGPG